jgi:hypothetical protein
MAMRSLGPSVTKWRVSFQQREAQAQLPRRKASGSRSTITEPGIPDAGRGRLLAIMCHKVRANELAK